ncbi:tetratricopeptide repeat protein [Kitasatospora misakiensis]|uniref:Tetratricopeptide repeat protein n=1 Tax=Kitasatospora misakiensis TaxID=67330 RepID=A0ABW0X726_9ACTN
MEAFGNRLDGNVSDSTVVMGESVSVHFHARRGPTLGFGILAPRIRVDHEDEFAAIDASWHASRRGGHAMRLGLRGIRGVGKTAVVGRWLHERAEQLPRTCLQATLGPDTRGRPVDPVAVLEGWLDLLEVPRDGLSREPAALRDLFRSVTSGKPVVVLLENAQTARQVEMLLPGSHLSVVIVTSAVRLGGLRSRFDVEDLVVEPLTPAESDELLCRVGELDAAAEADREPFVRLCGGNPLALRMVAERLAELPPQHWPELALRLREPMGRWELMRMDDFSFEDLLDAFYRSLRPEQALVYRRVGLNPGPVLDRGALQALTGVDVGRLDGVLADLRALHVFEREEPGCLWLNDLIQAHAWQKAQDDESPDARESALDKVIEYYTTCAEDAEAAASSRWRIDHAGRYRAFLASDPGAAEREEAVSRMARLGPSIIAAAELALESGRFSHTVRIGQGMWTYCLRNALHSEWTRVQGLAVIAAEADGDALTIARARFERGFARQDRFSSDHDDARLADADLTTALEICDRVPDPKPEGFRRTRSSVLEAMALLALRNAQPLRAEQLVLEALGALDGVDHLRGAALLGLHLGRIRTVLGRHEDARAVLSGTFDQFGDLLPPDRYNQARALTRLAENEQSAGQLDQALGFLTEALPLMGEHATPYQYQYAAILLLRGDVRRDLGDEVGAAEDWAAAQTCFAQARSPRQSEAADRLAGGRPPGVDGSTGPDQQ